MFPRLLCKNVKVADESKGLLRGRGIARMGVWGGFEVERRARDPARGGEVGRLSPGGGDGGMGPGKDKVEDAGGEGVCSLWLRSTKKGT
jgi:hypothetical protein